jgi:hypothetical protein
MRPETGNNEEAAGQTGRKQRAKIRYETARYFHENWHDLFLTVSDIAPDALFFKYLSRQELEDGEYTGKIAFGGRKTKKPGRRRSGAKRAAMFRRRD